MESTLRCPCRRVRWQYDSRIAVIVAVSCGLIGVMVLAVVECSRWFGCRREMFRRSALEVRRPQDILRHWLGSRGEMKRFLLMFG